MARNEVDQPVQGEAGILGKQPFCISKGLVPRVDRTGWEELCGGRFQITAKEDTH